MLAWKMRIAVLWIFGAVLQAAVMFMMLFEPGTIGDLIDGEWLGVDAHSSGVQLTLVFDLLAPMVMAFLTLVLQDSANRRTNLVVGSIGTVAAFLSLFGVASGGYGAGVISVVLVACTVGLLIVWHAWKWPSPAGVTAAQRTGEMTRSGGP